MMRLKVFTGVERLMVNHYLLIVLSILYRAGLAEDPATHGHPHKTVAEVRDIVNRYKIMPDIITLPPSHVIEVAYNSNVVNFGNHLTRAQTRGEPTHIRWDVDEGAYYALIMSDPDYPSAENPKLREYHHWLVVNIPGCDVKKGEVLSEYLGTQAPKDSGLHRYVFIVYRQPSGKIKYNIPFRESIPVETYRGHFSTDDFGREHQLGDPHAVNFFMSKWSNLDGSGFDPIGRM